MIASAYSYEALKRTTKGFRDMTPEPVIKLVWQTPLVLIVLRSMLGFTPSEWADAASSAPKPTYRKGSQVD